MFSFLEKKSLRLNCTHLAAQTDFQEPANSILCITKSMHSTSDCCTYIHRCVGSLKSEEIYTVRNVS